MTMNAEASRVPIMALVAGMAACFALLYSHALPPIELFTIAAIAGSGLYLALAFLLLRAPERLHGRTTLAILCAGIVFRILLLPVSPTGSDDIYRYLWDGKVQAAGFDPYRFAPADPALNGLHDTLLPGRVTYPELKTVYPPLAQWSFRVLYEIAGENLTGFKAGFVAADIATMFLLLLFLRRSGLPQALIGLYALCPLPILQFAVDGHCDALMFPFLIGMLLFWQAGKKLPGYIALGCAALAKLYPLVLLPALLKKEGVRRWVLGGTIAIGMVAAGYAQSFLAGGTPLEPLRVYSLNWAANGLLFEGIYHLIGNNQQAHTIAGVLILAWIVVLLLRKQPLEELVYYIVLGFFLFSATVHPWYLTAVAVLLPIVPKRSGIVFVALSSLVIIPLIGWVEHHRWEQSFWLMSIEYLPVYFLAWRELRPGAHRPPATPAAS